MTQPIGDFMCAFYLHYVNVLIYIIINSGLTSQSADYKDCECNRVVGIWSAFKPEGPGVIHLEGRGKLWLLTFFHLLLKFLLRQNLLAYIFLWYREKRGHLPPTICSSEFLIKRWSGKRAPIFLCTFSMPQKLTLRDATRHENNWANVFRSLNNTGVGCWARWGWGVGGRCLVCKTRETIVSYKSHTLLL